MTVVNIVSLVAGAAGVIFGLVTMFRNKKADDSAAGENKGVMMSDIGYIKAGVDDLKRENRETRSAIGELSERVTRVEESTKQAHKRIDEFKKGEKRIEN